MAILAKWPTLFIGLAMASSASAQTVPQDGRLTAISSVDLCKQIVDHPSQARELLVSEGWVEYDFDGGSSIAEFYDGPEAGWFVRGEDSVMFMSKDTVMGRRSPDFSGNCMTLFYGDGNLAATELAAHLGQPADLYAFEYKDYLHNFTFNLTGYNVYISNRTRRSDRTQVSGVTAITVEPA